MIDPEVQRNPVEELAEAFLERYRRGERPPLSEYTRQYPDLADEIRDLFPALAMMEEAGPGDAGRAASGLVASTGPALERLGDYRILREVGRGGMGIVYEAEQEALGRRVALKVLPLAIAANATSLQRFRREARSAARLHHTNIVPVYDVGAHQGVHYYAMQFIQGQGLDEVLLEVKRLRAVNGVTQGPSPAPGTGGNRPSDLSASLAGGLLTGRFRAEEPAEVNPGCQPSELAQAPTERPPAADVSAPPSPDVARPPEHATRPEANTAKSDVLRSQSEFSAESDFHYYRSVARVGLQVAEALAYAQGQKVLHRDIKPSNLLLDMQGTVWVTDFGLAKEEGSDLTRPGDVVGTLRYMAPERFSGISDARSDIYSLGLTLYELLALKPAIEESHRDQLLRRINHEELPPLRRWDRHVPRDLETIVLKASAKEPQRRYQTAEALAEDLRRFLADRAILARRSWAAERLWRWCRRNRAVASLSTALVVLLAVLGAGAMVASLLRQERNKAVAAQERAQQLERENKIRSHLNKATAYRRSRQVGQRFKALAEVAAAVQLDPPDELRADLRTEAIACLLLPDFEVEKECDCPAGSGCLAFDAAFKQYARSDKDGNVSIRLVADNRELLSLHGAGEVDPCGGHEFSRDGRFLHQRYKTPKGWRSRLWKLDGLKPVALLDNEHFGFAFCPDGRECAAYYPKDGSLCVYETATGKERRRWRLNLPRSDLRLSWNPKRPLLVAWALSDQGVRILNAETGRVEWQVPTTNKASWIDWHPEGRLLAVAEQDRRIRLWDTDTRQLALPPLEGHKNYDIMCRFDPSGERLLSNDWSNIWRLWDVQTGRQLLAPSANGTCLQFDPTGTLAAADAVSPRLRMFRYRSGQEFRTLIPGRGPQMHDAGANFSMPVDRQGRLLAVAPNDGIVLLDIARGEEFRLLRMPRNAPLAFEPSGALLTNGLAGLLRWPVTVDPATDQRRYGPPERLYPPTNRDGHGASADGRVLAIPNYNRGAIVLHRDGNRTVPLGPQQDVRYCAVSPDGRWVASGSHWLHEGAGAKVWDAQTGAHLADLPAAGECPVGFSPDGKWLATGGGGVRLWKAGTWQPGPPIVAPNHADFAFAADSRLLAVQDEPGIVRLIAPETGKEVARLTAPVDTPLRPRCFSPDGTQLITNGDDRAVHVFDLAAIRRQLRDIGLDWDPPPDPPAAPAIEPRRPLKVEVILGELATFKPEEKARHKIAHYRQVLEGKPDDALACDYLAWAYATGPEALRDLKQALFLAEKAVRLQPKNLNYRKTLGVVYYRTGRYRHAIETLQANLPKQEDGLLAIDLYFLAMSHHKLGEAATAQLYYDWATRWPVPPRATEEERAELADFRAEAAALLSRLDPTKP
jgi:serine/threonine protein kinase/WD40 repeat protein